MVVLGVVTQMFAQRIEGFVGDHVLHFAGVLTGSLGIYTQTHQHTGQQLVTGIDLLGDLQTLLGQPQIAGVFHRQIATVL